MSLNNYIISVLASSSSSSTMIFNDTKHSVEVMEGIEGVYRSLGSIPPREDFLVRSVKKYCSYAVFPKPYASELDEMRNKYCRGSKIAKPHAVIPSNRFLSSRAVLVFCRDNGTLYVQEGSSESGEAQAPGYRTRGHFQRFIEEFSNSPLLVKSPNERIRMDPAVAHCMLIHEINCFSWITDDDRNRNLGPRMARKALELWESKEKVFKLQIDSFEAELKDCNNQIFQWLIGFYTVVHGVLFTVVSQPDSPFTCGKIHISYILSAIVSFITIAGVVQKLKPLENLDEIMYEHKARLLAVCTWQSNLKSTAYEFDYGTAVLDYMPRPVTRWWLPKFLPLRAVKYILIIVMCSSVLCYIMHLVKCN